MNILGRRPLRGAVAASIVFVANSALAQPLPITPTGALTILHTFSAIDDRAGGDMPQGGLVLGNDGNFYGTNMGGTGRTLATGTIFQITPSGSLKTLYTFDRSEGGTPRGTMAKDKDGNFYGTTWASAPGGRDAGAAFRITPGGVFTSFGKLPGTLPNGLTFASDGNLYGTVSRGGARGAGAFYRLTTSGVFTTLHDFGGPENLAPPEALVEGPDGALYGTSPGAVIKVTKQGAVTALIAVTGSSNSIATFDGLGPLTSGLVLAGDGTFYGASTLGIFRVTPTGVFTRVCFFADVGLRPDGQSPYHDNRRALILGSDGNMYGTDLLYVYQITVKGAVTIVHWFNRITSLDQPRDNAEGLTPSMLAQGPDGLYGTTSMGGGLGRGGTVFKVTCPSCGGAAAGAGPTPPGGPVKPAGRIEVIDPNNPALLPLFSGAVKWDQKAYDTYATHTRLASGLAADGVTHVAVRWRVPQAGEVTFTITDETKNSAVQVGSLGCIYSAACAPFTLTTYTVPAEQISDGYMAFALLRAPMDFARSGVPGDAGEPLRTINVTATQPASNATADLAIILARPPVVLLHGLWSEKATWDWPIQCPPTVNPLPGCIVFDSRFIVWAQDYKNQNADHFEVNLGFVPVKGINQPREGARIALDQLRAREIAATQVDFVGHSMGGLLGRLYAGGYKGIEYYRDDNLHAGDIHKLITLDTPHYGSELAPQLLDPTATEESTLGFLFSPLGCMTCGAVADLRPGSEPLSNMPLAAVPSHAIVGVGGTESLAVINTANSWMPLYLKLVLTNDINNAVQWDSVCSFGSLNHDVIVSAPSQVGGIAADAVSFFQFEASADNRWWWAIHFTVTKESRIAKRVVELLNEPVHSAMFGQFPAVTAPRQGVGGSCL